MIAFAATIAFSRIILQEPPNTQLAGVASALLGYDRSADQLLAVRVRADISNSADCMRHGAHHRDTLLVGSALLRREAMKIDGSHTIR